MNTIIGIGKWMMFFRMLQGTNEKLLKKIVASILIILMIFYIAGKNKPKEHVNKFNKYRLHKIR